MKMAFQLVSLLASLMVASVWGQYPMLGGFGSPYMQYGNQFQNRNHQQQVDPNMLTCIGADIQDVQSQIRITIRPMQSSLGGPAHMGMGFGGMGTNHDQPQDWTINGMLLPSQVVQKVGAYQMGIFEGGRTFGECKMSALGQVLNTNNNHMLGYGMGGLGPWSPMAFGMNPFASMYGGFGQQNPNGVVSNTAVLSTGTTMYSGMVRGVSYNDMVGRSIGVCQTIQGGQCYGLIPYCCSITRDALPSSEVYMDPIANNQQVGLGFGGNNLLAGQTGVAGNLPLATGGAAAVAVDSGGIF